MSRTIDRWGISVAFRLPLAAYHAAVRQAQDAGVSLSAWTKNVIVAHLSVGNGEPPKPKRTWADECALMDEMGPGDANAYFLDRLNGRALPFEFGHWQRAQQIAWLDKEMPL